MRKFRSLITAFILLFVVQTQAHAWFFIPVLVFDAQNFEKNIKTFIDDAVTAMMEKVDTVKNLEKLARLIEIAENARDLTQSFSSAYVALNRMKEYYAPPGGETSRFIKSWTTPPDSTGEGGWTIDSVGTMLERWGVEPAQNGWLPAIDNMMFGEGSILGSWKDTANHLEDLAYRTQGRYTRDSFLRRIFTQTQMQDDIVESAGNQGEITMDINGKTHVSTESGASMIREDIAGEVFERQTGLQEVIDRNARAIEANNLLTERRAAILRKDLETEQKILALHMKRTTGMKIDDEDEDLHDPTHETTGVSDLLEDQLRIKATTLRVKNRQMELDAVYDQRLLENTRAMIDVKKARKEAALAEQKVREVMGQ